MKLAMGTSEAPRTLRTTLPARAYTDGAWFAIEMDRRVRADVAGGGPRGSARSCRRVHSPRRRRRERADRARRGRLDSRAPQRLPPSRHASLCRGTRHLPGQHPVPVSRVDLRSRRPAAGRAADGRGRAASIDRSFRFARSRARRGTATSSSTLQIRRRRWPRSSATCRRALRRGRCRTCGSPTASSTTSPPTGSSSCRTTTSACTAR